MDAGVAKSSSLMFRLSPHSQCLLSHHDILFYKYIHYDMKLVLLFYSISLFIETKGFFSTKKSVSSEIISKSLLHSFTTENPEKVLIDSVACVTVIYP